MSGNKLIQLNERMAQLSIAYVHTMASHLGYGADIPGVDHDSIDLTISSSSGRKVKLDVQLKSTTKFDGKELEKDFFSYPLPINNYNDLRIETLCPRILVILCMPVDPSKWITHSVEQLLIRKCAYWISLQGEPDSTNISTININVPTKNVFSPECLEELMLKIDNGETITDD